MDPCSRFLSFSALFQQDVKLQPIAARKTHSHDILGWYSSTEKSCCSCDTLSCTEIASRQGTPAALAFAFDHCKSVRERVVYQSLSKAAKLIPCSKLPTTCLPFVPAFVVNPVQRVRFLSRLAIFVAKSQAWVAITMNARRCSASRHSDILC